MTSGNIKFERVYGLNFRSINRDYYSGLMTYGYAFPKF